MFPRDIVPTNCITREIGELVFWSLKELLSSHYWNSIANGYVTSIGASFGKNVRGLYIVLTVIQYTSHPAHDIWDMTAYIFIEKSKAASLLRFWYPLYPEVGALPSTVALWMLNYIKYVSSRFCKEFPPNILADGLQSPKREVAVTPCKWHVIQYRPSGISVAIDICCAIL